MRWFRHSAFTFWTVTVSIGAALLLSAVAVSGSYRPGAHAVSVSSSLRLDTEQAIMSMRTSGVLLVALSVQPGPRLGTLATKVSQQAGTIAGKRLALGVTDTTTTMLTQLAYDASSLAGKATKTPVNLDNVRSATTVVLTDLDALTNVT